MQRGLLSWLQEGEQNELDADAIQITPVLQQK